MAKQAQIESRQSSRFTGRPLGLIWINFITFLISIISAGLLIPVAVVMKQKWFAKKTYYRGRRLVFTGRASGLFGNYLKWLLFSILTLGFFFFLIPVRIERWVVANTHFADGKKRGKSEFTGRSFGFYFRWFLAIVMSVISIGLLLTTAIAFVQKWYNQNKIIDGYQMRFTGRGIHLFGNYLKWMFFTLITLGIYSFWLPVKFKGWIVKNTVYGAQPDVSTESLPDEYALETSDEFADFDEFGEILDFEEEFGEMPLSAAVAMQAPTPAVSAPAPSLPAVGGDLISKKARGHYGLPIVFGLISLFLMPNLVALIHGVISTILLPVNYVIILLISLLARDGEFYSFIVDIYADGIGETSIFESSILVYFDLRYYIFEISFFIVAFVLSLIGVIKAFKYRGPKKVGFSRAIALIPLILIAFFIVTTILIAAVF